MPAESMGEWWCLQKVYRNARKCLCLNKVKWNVGRGCACRKCGGNGCACRKCMGMWENCCACIKCWGMAVLTESVVKLLNFKKMQENKGIGMLAECTGKCGGMAMLAQSAGELLGGMQGNIHE